MRCRDSSDDDVEALNRGGKPVHCPACLKNYSCHCHIKKCIHNTHFIPGNSPNTTTQPESVVGVGALNFGFGVTGLAAFGAAPEELGFVTYFPKSKALSRMPCALDQSCFKTDISLGHGMRSVFMQDTAAKKDSFHTAMYAVGGSTFHFAYYCSLLNLKLKHSDLRPPQALYGVLVHRYQEFHNPNPIRPSWRSDSAAH